MAKQKRRDNHSGSIYEDPQGQWWAIAPPDPATKKRARRRAKDRADAKAKLAQMLKDRAAGVNITLKNPTLEEFVKLWLEQYVANSCKPKTYENYESHLRCYILPRLGKLKVSSLTYAALLSNQNALMNEDKHSAGTTDAARSAIRACLNAAVEWGYIAANPASKLPKPKGERRRFETWTPEQVRRFLAFVKDHPLHKLFLITFHLGLRRGEGVGIRWFDVDFKRRTVRIAHTIGQGNHGAREGDTKNDRVRILPMSNAVLRAFEAQREYVRQRLPADATTMFVFPTSKGTPYQPSNVYHQFVTLIDAYNAQPGVAKLPRIRYHDMRHSCATILLDEGVDIKLIGAILGHSTVSVTADIYAHLTERGAQRVVDAMDKAMEG